MPDFKIRQEDPPAKTRKVGNSSKIDREVRFMMRHPGVWYKVREAAAAGAYTVYKKRGCETRTKTVQGNRYDIWAMFPGTEEDDA